MGHGPHSSKIVVLFYVLFVLCRSVYCLCVNVYCTTAKRWQPNCSLTNISISYNSSVATCCQQSSCDHMFITPSWLFGRYLPQTATSTTMTNVATICGLYTAYFSITPKYRSVTDKSSFNHILIILIMIINLTQQHALV